MSRTSGSRSRRSIVTFLVVLLMPLAAQATWLAQSASAGRPVPVTGNNQDGDTQSETAQTGASNSGDAVGGQVVGVNSTGGETSVDATNRSEDVDLESGGATGANTVDGFVGHQASGDGDVGFTEQSCFLNNTTGSNTCNVEALAVASNSQGSENSSDIAQAADATTGDAVGGQVIGVVSGGITDITASNTSEDVDVETGDASATNSATVFAGLLASAETTVLFASQECGNFDQTGDTGTIAPIGNTINCIDNFNANAINTQDGDNSSDLTQASDATSGDGVGGQVIGVVSPGNTTIDATNSSEDLDIETGNATSANNADVFAGLSATANGGAFAAFTSCGNITQDETGGGAAIIAPVGNTIECENNNSGNAQNTQDGDNASDLAQAANTTTGDGVGGQVIGAVSSGNTDIVASNSSEDVDIETGDANSTNNANVDVGLTADASGGALLTANICGNIDQTEEGSGGALVAPVGNTVVCENNNSADSTNEQTGDNSSDLAQAADSASGDGVGGQVLGVVSSGDTSIDATNSSSDIDIETGDAASTNNADVAVGMLADSGGGALLTANVCGNIIQTETGGVLAAGAAIAPIGNTTECVNDNSATSDNTQDGDNASNLGQAANATSGDGVGGQVIGAVTSGTTDIVAANTSDDVDIETGDANSTNDADVAVGLSADASGGSLLTANVCGNIVQNESGTGGALIAPVVNETECENDNSAEADNEQTGDNDADLTQAADAASGDGVGGQVLGVVSSGDTSVDATNSSQDIDIETGDADSSNNADVAVGLLGTPEGGALVAANICANIVQTETGAGAAIIAPVGNEVECANESGASTDNEQEGDNASDLAQASNATTGDGVGGQVIGAVTSGSADIVAANTSEDVDIETGDADSSNDAGVAVGQQAGSDGAVRTGGQPVREHPHDRCSCGPYG